MCRDGWGARRACPRIDEGPKVPVPTGFDASSKSILSNLSDLYSHQSHQSHRTYHRRSVPSVRSVLSVPKQKTRRSALHEKRLVVSAGTDSLSFIRTLGNVRFPLAAGGVKMVQSTTLVRSCGQRLVYENYPSDCRALGTRRQPDADRHEDRHVAGGLHAGGSRLVSLAPAEFWWQLEAEFQCEDGMEMR